ncbi:MAG: hypothetical protein Q8O64_19755 [Sideroxyarcus sp.]|nr:hypothetical protein [Sideroxyarcus sp.]
MYNFDTEQRELVRDAQGHYRYVDYDSVDDDVVFPVEKKCIRDVRDFEDAANDNDGAADND